MRATHIDYKHWNHLRVEHGEDDGSGGVWCVAPSASLYAKLSRPGLPSLDPKLRAKKLAELKG